MALRHAFRRKTAKKGIEAAKKIKPDVITVDFSMPVMNGLAAASETAKALPENADNSVHPICRQSVKNSGFQGERKPAPPENRAASHAHRLKQSKCSVTVLHATGLRLTLT
jgi:CheY-like chemotaxis protein